MLARPLLSLCCTLSLVLVACGGDAKKDAKGAKTDAKADAKVDPDASKRNDSTSLDKAVTALDLGGAAPPEVSAVFYTVDGALIPIGCFDKAKNKLDGGKDCLHLAKAGEEVYLRSTSVEKLDKAGPPKSPMCQPGEDKPSGVSVPSVDAGEPFDYAVYPKSMGKLVNKVGEETWSEKGRVASDDEKKALVALAGGAGELQINQSVSFDVDSDGKPDKLFSVYVVDPKDSERLAYSSVLLQRGSDPSRWVPVIESRNDTETYTVRAFIDLNGDRTHELWINAVLTDGGGGDRMFKLKDGGADPLAKWSCGV